MPPMVLEEIDCLTSERFIARTQQKIRLGPISVDIRSNEAQFIGLRYFPESSRANREAQTDYTLSFCNLNVDGPWPVQTLAQLQGSSYRAKRFAVGYYITDHFGEPAYLVTRGTHYWIFGTAFEAILWPYVVKLLLTLYSMEHGMLHLKAAAIAFDGAGSLLVGRGGSGKTVLLTRLCQSGAQFLSNTHTVIDGDRMIAVPAAMRVRKDALFGPIIAARQLPVGIKAGEHIADPCQDLGWQSGTSAVVKNICLLDYRGLDRCEIRSIDRDTLFDYMEQFSLALNVYGLKEDVLDHLVGDVCAFSEAVGQMRTRLRALVGQCSGYYVSCDANDPKNLATIEKLLSH